MSVFEDAITRWRHSRSCRYGVVNNFQKRRELEAKALQNTTVLNPVEARVEQSIQMSDLATGATNTVQVKDENGVEILTSPEDFTCFICHKKFQSMEEMRHHVKFPCNASKIVTTRVPHPKHSVPVFIESVPPRRSWDQSQTIEIQQQPATYIQEQNYLPQHHQGHMLEQQLQVGGSVEVCLQDSGSMDQGYATSSTVSYDPATGAGPSAATPSGEEEQKNLTPTTIYVNEKGETVIEVENLDLSSDGGELSLAHLLTQLSQQGIVFDKSRSASLQPQDFVLESPREQPQTQVYQVEGQEQMSVQTEPGRVPHDQREALGENESLALPVSSIKEDDEEEGQPTAEDAANTLAQLAGFRGYIQKQQQEAGPGAAFVQQNSGTHQAMEMIHLTGAAPVTATAIASSSLPVTHAVQAYQYASPVTIQYSYAPSSESVAVVSDQVQHAGDHNSHHQVVGAQHMTLQEVLTAGTATQLFIKPDSGAVIDKDIKEVKPVEGLSELESVRYVVDPVTGHQVMQQVEPDGSLEQSDCLYQHQQHDEGAVTEQTSEIGHIPPQEVGMEHQVNSHAEAVSEFPVTSEASNSLRVGTELNNSTAPAELTAVTIAASSEELVHMETDQNPSEPQEDFDDALDDNTRSEDHFPIQNVTEMTSSNQSESVDASFQTQSVAPVLDISAKVSLSSSGVLETQSAVSVVSHNTPTTFDSDNVDLQLVTTTTAASDPDNSTCLTVYNQDEAFIPPPTTECVDSHPQDIGTADLLPEQHQQDIQQAGPETQEHFRVVTCQDLEQDIPPQPVEAPSDHVVGLMTSEAKLGHSAQVEVDLNASGGELGSVSGMVVIEEQPQQAHVEVELQTTGELEVEEQQNYGVTYVTELDQSGVAVSEPYRESEPADREASVSAAVVEDASVGAEHQALVEELHQQQQVEMSTMFVVTSTGIQPVSRHDLAET